MEDQVLSEAKREIDAEIILMKQKQGQQVVDYPKINYNIKGGKYIIDFLIDQRRSDIWSVLLEVIFTIQQELSDEKNSLKKKVFEKSVKLKTYKKDDILTFIYEFDELGDKGAQASGTITIHGQLTIDRPSIKLSLEKDSELTKLDRKIIISAYKEANKHSQFTTQKANNNSQVSSELKWSNDKLEQDKAYIKQMKAKILGDRDKGLGDEKVTEEEYQKISFEEEYQKIKEMGVMIFSPDDKQFLEGLNWDCLAGYEKQKRDIEDTVMLSLTHGDVYDSITAKTRMRFERNRPRAVLFEGPPGTGKTTSAKIIASQVKIPL